MLSQSNKLDSLLDLLKTAKDTQKVNVLNNLASEYKYSDMDIAFQYSQEGLVLAEKLNFKKGIAKSSHIIGAIYELQKKPHEAIDHFLYALKIQEELNDKKGIADASVNVGIAYAEIGNLATSRQFMLKALNINKKIGNNEGIAEVLMNLGGTFEVEKKWQEALDYYNQSLKLRGELGNKTDITKCLNNIGFVYYAKGDYDNAKKYLLESTDIANKTQSRNILKANYEILSDIYVNEKQFERAFEYQKLFAKIKDSLMNEKSIRQLQELEGKYEAGKKQKKIELLNKEKEKQELLSDEENKRKNIIIISIFTGLILTIVFFVFLFNRFRIIKRQKIIIEEKNKDITDSINYAKRIQNSLLPTEKYIDKSLKRLKKNI